MANRSYLSIGEVLASLRAEFPDVTISKIRFLESQGLVDPERTPSGYRKFYEHDVERLRWVLRQQREHFLPLKVIKGRLDNNAGDGTDIEEEQGQLPFSAITPSPVIRVGPNGLISDEPTPSDPALNGSGTDNPAGIAPHPSATNGSFTNHDIAPNPAVSPSVTGHTHSTVATGADVSASSSASKPAAVVHEDVTSLRMAASGSIADSASGIALSRPKGAVPAEDVTTHVGWHDSPADTASPESQPPKESPAPPDKGSPATAGSPSASGALPEDSSAVPGATATSAAVTGSPVGPAASGTSAGPGLAGTPAAPSAAAPAAPAAPAKGSSATPATPTGSAPKETPITAATDSPAAPRSQGVRSQREAGTTKSAKVEPSLVPPPTPEIIRQTSGRDTKTESDPQMSGSTVADMSGASLTAEELAAAVGLTVREISDLESFGLISGRPLGGTTYFDEDALIVGRLVAGFARFGLEARHLRTYKHAADREAGLIEQVVMPLMKQRNPESRRKAAESAVELSALGQGLRAALVKSALRNLTGG